MDPLIMLANKVPHLSHDQLPPLSDYDHSRYLSRTASKVHTFLIFVLARSHDFASSLTHSLEPSVVICFSVCWAILVGTTQFIMTGHDSNCLLLTGWELTVIFFGSLLHGASTFVAPIGINRTLT